MMGLVSASQMFSYSLPWLVSLKNASTEHGDKHGMRGIDSLAQVIKGQSFNASCGSESLSRCDIMAVLCLADGMKFR